MLQPNLTTTIDHLINYLQETYLEKCINLGMVTELMFALNSPWIIKLQQKKSTPLLESRAFKANLWIAHKSRVDQSPWFHFFWRTTRAKVSRSVNLKESLVDINYSNSLVVDHPMLPALSSSEYTITFSLCATRIWLCQSVAQCSMKEQKFISGNTD